MLIKTNPAIMNTTTRKKKTDAQGDSIVDGEHITRKKKKKKNTR